MENKVIITVFVVHSQFLIDPNILRSLRVAYKK